MAEMMVQNSISQKPVGRSTKSRIPTPADYEKFQLGAIPYVAKGHLVKTPIWKTPVVAVEDTFQNIKNIGRGIKGQSNDHELGQMNDLTVKAGGLALAGYLATKRVLPTKKGMEFVGFASFFTSMVLFPKIFINTPNKMVHGFNVDQKYVDSYGRKKSFHMDPQYTPYDLYAPEEIEKIGDKMGVDKDMENRQDFVKRKMTKIATQSNTMWMLTAGLATPIMGALISNRIEKVLNKAQQNQKTKQVNSKLTNLVANLQNPEALLKQKQSKNEALSTLLNNNVNKKVDDKFVDQLVKLMDKNNDLNAEDALKKDLNHIIGSNKVPDVAEFLGDISIELPKKFNTAPIVFSQKDIKKCLTDAKLNEKVEINANTTDEIRNRLFKGLVKAEANKYPSEVAGNDDLVTALNTQFTSKINAKLNTPPRILTQDNIDTIHKAAKALNTFSIKKNILAEYVDHKVGNKEDSVMAREWKTASEGIMEAMGFSHKQLEQMKKSPASANKVMEAKLTEIAKDDNKYKATMEKVAKLINNFDEKINVGSVSAKDGEDKNIQTFKEEVTHFTNTFHNDFATEAKDSLKNVSTYIAGNVAENIPNSASKNAIEAADNRILGAKGSLYKVIQGLDMFKRLEDKSVENSIKAVNSDKDFVAKTIQTMKFAIIEGTYDNHNVKFDIEDPKIYKSFMENAYTPELSKTTTEIIGQNGTLLTNVQDHIKDVRDQLGNSFNRFKPSCRLDYDQREPGFMIDKDGFFLEKIESKDKNGVSTTKLKQLPKELHDKELEKRVVKFVDKGNLKKQMLTGETLSKFAQKSSEQMHNTKHWLRLFGGIGAGVGIITLASPFFFGKIKAPTKKGKKEVVTNG